MQQCQHMYQALRQTLQLSALIFLLFSAVSAQKFNDALRLELLAMEKNDQAVRIECNEKAADKMIDCLAKIAETTDRPNTQRLNEIVDKYGVPTTEVAGKDGFRAFMIVLQHATSDALREKCLKPIKKAFERKEMPPEAYANFVDRLRVHQGKLQMYGCNFDIKDGKLVMSRTKDPKNLDRRRAKIGLPPIAEYAKILAEMYHMEAVVQPE